ncbi:Hypothetical predicted protein [Paramuricea clavata]|uniref:Uncharacterized protein n=1 Tax=Paramuricea clavata TaxID=317549 RepID=A0A6S7JQU4_PARCT|nr:Hypothetical predicted protein [Paramuricea clavata]
MPLILLTSITGYHVIPISPDKFNKVGDKIFITLSPDGAGHYDALQELDTIQEDEKNIAEKENKCTCGMNRKASKSKENCKDSKTESGRTYVFHAVLVYVPRRVVESRANAKNAAIRLHVTNPETLNADTDNQKLHNLTKNFNASILESGRGLRISMFIQKLRNKLKTNCRGLGGLRNWRITQLKNN